MSSFFDFETVETDSVNVPNFKFHKKLSQALIMKWNLLDGNKNNRLRLYKTFMLSSSLFVLGKKNSPNKNSLAFELIWQISHPPGLHKQIFDKTIYDIIEPFESNTETLASDIRYMNLKGHFFGGGIACLCLWALAMQAQAVQLPFATLGMVTQFLMPRAMEMIKPLTLLNGIGNAGTFICRYCG